MPLPAAALTNYTQCLQTACSVHIPCAVPRECERYTDPCNPLQEGARVLSLGAYNMCTVCTTCAHCTPGIHSVYRGHRPSETAQGWATGRRAAVASPAGRPARRPWQPGGRSDALRRTGACGQHNRPPCMTCAGPDMVLPLQWVQRNIVSTNCTRYAHNCVQCLHLHVG